MKTLPLLLIFVSALASAACGQTIRVATYNVNWGNRRGDLLWNAISTADPDILCLQETTPQSERFLRKHLADRYPHFHSVGHESRYTAERFVFASKVELGDLTFHPPDAGLFGFYSATFRLGADSIHIDIENGKVKSDAPPAQLYDLEKDVRQTQNLYREYPEVVKEMEALLQSYRSLNAGGEDGTDMQMR